MNVCGGVHINVLGGHSRRDSCPVSQQDEPVSAKMTATKSKVPAATGL